MFYSAYRILLVYQLMESGTYCDAVTHAYRNISDDSLRKSYSLVCVALHDKCATPGAMKTQFPVALGHLPFLFRESGQKYGRQKYDFAEMISLSDILLSGASRYARVYFGTKNVLLALGEWSAYQRF